MSEVIGVKHDGGKPWAGTVLAGFWPQLRGLFSDQLTDNAVLSDDEFQDLCGVLDAFFDTSLAISDRLVRAATYLTDHVTCDTYLPHVIDVGTYGARKYDRDNWLHVEGGVERYYEAAGRHVRDVLLGDWRDEESGCVNLGHIAWGILAGAELVRRADKPMILNADHETMQALGLHNPRGVSLGPALKLPLEVGKTYRLDYAGTHNAGAESRDAVANANDLPRHPIELDGWYYTTLGDPFSPGYAPALTGPVSP